MRNIIHGVNNLMFRGGIRRSNYGALTAGGNCSSVNSQLFLFSYSGWLRGVVKIDHMGSLKQQLGVIGTGSGNSSQQSQLGLGSGWTPGWVCVGTMGQEGSSTSAPAAAEGTPQKWIWGWKVSTGSKKPFSKWGFFLSEEHQSTWVPPCCVLTEVPVLFCWGECEESPGCSIAFAEAPLGYFLEGWLCSFCCSLQLPELLNSCLFSLPWYRAALLIPQEFEKLLRTRFSNYPIYVPSFFSCIHNLDLVQIENPGNTLFIPVLESADMHNLYT